MFIVPGDIGLNPGLVYNSQSSCLNEWNVFEAKGIHLTDLNFNSLLPKIDEFRHIAARTNAAAIRISESKLDETIFQSEIQYLTMSCSDVIGTEMVEVLLAMLEVIFVIY